MSMTIKLHGPFHQLSEHGTLTVPIQQATTVAEFSAQWQLLLDKSHPNLAQLIPHCRFAVNNQLVEENHPLKASDSITILPPVSGG